MIKTREAEVDSRWTSGQQGGAEDLAWEVKEARNRASELVAENPEVAHFNKARFEKVIARFKYAKVQTASGCPPAMYLSSLQRESLAVANW